MLTFIPNPYPHKSPLELLAGLVKSGDNDIGKGSDTSKPKLIKLPDPRCY